MCHKLGHPAHITSSVEWRSPKACKSRCPQPRCENRYILFICGCGAFIVFAVVILIFLIRGKWLQCQIIPVWNLLFSNLASGKIDVHLKLNRDTEEQVTKPSVIYDNSRQHKRSMDENNDLYNISREHALFMDQDNEQQVTKSSVLYDISVETKLHLEQELVLWLSCFIICTPWILAQCETIHLWYSLVHHTQALRGGVQI